MADLMLINRILTLLPKSSTHTRVRKLFIFIRAALYSQTFEVLRQHLCEAHLSGRLQLFAEEAEWILRAGVEGGDLSFEDVAVEA